MKNKRKSPPPSVRSRRFKIYEPVYGVEYLVQVGGTEQEAVNAYAKLLGVEPWSVTENPARRGMFFCREPAPQGGIWLHESAWAGVVAHECFHAVAYTMERLKVPLNEGTEEVFAYYLQWMLNEILPKLEVWKGYAEHIRKELGRKRRR